MNWRPEHEERVLNSTVVNGIVLRSSLAFGRSEANSIVGKIFEVASKGESFEWSGRKGGRYALVHVDDMADMFLRVAEAVSEATFQVNIDVYNFLFIGPYL